ncbi:MAG: TadE/TadG family type IV pilus assembly protein [Pseudomonadota bacterium]
MKFGSMKRRSGTAHKLRSRLGRFLSQEDGSATVELSIILLPLLMVVMTVAEVSIGYFNLESKNKAAQLGARLAAAESPLHSDVWLTNQLITANGQIGDACFQESGNDVCVDPGIVWVCDYSGGALTAECDSTLFTNLVNEMRRIHGGLDPEDVRVEYIYRRLGQAGQQFQPEIRVTIQATTLPVNLLSLIGVTTIRPSVASNFSEDMTS